MSEVRIQYISFYFFFFLFFYFFFVFLLFYFFPPIFIVLNVMNEMPNFYLIIVNDFLPSFPYIFIET